MWPSRIVLGGPSVSNATYDALGFFLIAVIAAVVVVVFTLPPPLSMTRLPCHQQGGGVVNQPLCASLLELSFIKMVALLACPLTTWLMG